MKLQWEFCWLSEIKVNKPDSDKVGPQVLCGVLDRWTRGAGTFHLMPLLCTMVSQLCSESLVQIPIPSQDCNPSPVTHALETDAGDLP